MNSVTKLLLKHALEGVLKSLQAAKILLEEREKTTGEDAPETLHFRLKDIEAKLDNLTADLDS